MINKADKFINRYTRTLSVIGSWCLFVTMLIIVVDILGRYIFNSPLSGTPEIVRNAIVVILYLQLPYATLEERHVRTTVVYDKVPDKVKNILNIISYSIGIFLFIIIVINAYDNTIKTWILSEYEGEGAIKIPTYPIRAMILFGSSIVVYHLSRLVSINTLRLLPFGLNKKQ